MNGELDEPIFSQELMRQPDDLVFPSYNFGSEQQQYEPGQHAPGCSQQDVGAADVWGQGVCALIGTASGSGRPPNGAQAEQHRGRRRAKQHGKIFSDPVHGTFRLDPINVAVIDTPQFQRLRELHQLGLTHLVFPGAVHTRFEHSLGTSFKAFEMADRIYRTQGLELGMDKDDIRLVSLAGLCHDLGHGPFSHVFEYEFLRRKKLGLDADSPECLRLQEWHHETMSTKILEYLVDDNYIEGIQLDDIRRISDFIRGDIHEDRGYLFDIVSNKRCGVDVDKMDYLQRDALMCDVNIGCDFKRLAMLTKVLHNQICYKWSEYSNLHDLFHARESMHRKVYSHRKTKAVEFMVVDALLEADQALCFSENIYRAEDFCKLNDSLLSFIENYDMLPRRLAPPLDNGADACLVRAQAIIKRLRRRELYRFGNQFTVPVEELNKQDRWKAISNDFTAEKVAAAYRGGDVSLRPEDVIVSTTKIDYTQGGGNPLDNMLFWNESDDVDCFPLKPEQVQGIWARYHEERILRVYTPRTEPAYQAAVGQALAAWCKQRFGTNIQLATPARPRLLVERLPREAAMQDADPRRGGGRPPQAPSSVTFGTCANAVGNGHTASVGQATAAGSAASGSRIGGGGAAAAGCGENYGTPTRSTPYSAVKTTATTETDPGSRSKRSRSLFQD